MKLGIVAESLADRVALAVGLVPTPLFDTWLGFMVARTIMVATKRGVFDALADGPSEVSMIASRCGTNPQATEKLLRALVGTGYLQLKGDRYQLASVARKWLLKGAPSSYRDRILFQFLEWDWWLHCEDFLVTGEPIRIHERMQQDDWAIYQRGMRAGKDRAAHEVARQLPDLSRAREMLDIGGSHGLYSVALCRRYSKLHATILDLPEAIRHAAPLLARERMGDRIVHRAGDALIEDLGTTAYDVVFMASIVHHFDNATNQDLVTRIAQALRPGGVLAIMEVPRSEPSGKVSQMGGMLDLYFAMTSQSGAWSVKEIAAWQANAGLTPGRPIYLRAMRNVALQIATKRK